MSTTRRENEPLPRIFTGRRERAGHLKTTLACRGALSPAEPISGQEAVKKKRELFPGLPDVSGFVRVTAHHPRTGSGILTRFPFDGRAKKGRVRRSSPVS